MKLVKFGGDKSSFSEMRLKVVIGDLQDTTRTY